MRNRIEIIMTAMLLAPMLAGPGTARGQQPQMQNVMLTITPKMAGDTFTFEGDELQALLQETRFQTPAGVPVYVGMHGGSPSMATVIASVQQANLLSEQEQKAVAQGVEQQLKALVKSDVEMKPDQRAARLAEIDKQLTWTYRKSAAVDNLVGARSDPASALAERLKRLRETQQALQMQYAAKEARQKALQVGVERLKVESAKQRDDDAIVSELRKLLELREQDLKRARELAKTGTISSTEVAQAEAAAAEARIRLAERQASLGKAGKGELMDRMSDELASVSVDMIELDIQLNRVSSDIAEYDLAKLDAKKLDELMSREPQLGGADRDKAEALKRELLKQANQLLRERFVLKVDDVSVSVNK